MNAQPATRMGGILHHIAAVWEIHAATGEGLRLTPEQTRNGAGLLRMGEADLQILGETLSALEQDMGILVAELEGDASRGGVTLNTDDTKALALQIALWASFALAALKKVDFRAAGGAIAAPVPSSRPEPELPDGVVSLDQHRRRPQRNPWEARHERGASGHVAGADRRPGAPGRRRGRGDHLS